MWLKPEIGLSYKQLAKANCNKWSFKREVVESIAVSFS